MRRLVRFGIPPVWILFALCAVSAPSQTKKMSAKEAMNWFVRAQEQMDLRLPGSSPFHLVVKFHAFPGLELVPPEKAEILSGDGTYEETWVAPNQWRREVTLGGYHAIETFGNHFRKMQATSDFVPSRVIMLVIALFGQISSYNLTPYLESQHHWEMRILADGTHRFVKISTPVAHNNLLDIETAYIFLPNGVLVQSSEWDVTTTWEDDFRFAGRIVPRHILIQANGERDMMKADLTIEPANSADSSLFDLPAPEAEPGMTLRPLPSWKIKVPVARSYASLPLLEVSLPSFLFRVTMTRDGHRRDVELITVAKHSEIGSMRGAAEILASIRQGTVYPAEVDGSPCQTTWTQLFPSGPTDSLANHWGAK